MNERKATKRALLTSITALVMCVVMLAGTTFAWFTDTAKTGVNKIQAGNLKVAIVDASGNSLEGQTLNWVKATNAPADQAILWEPGATYELQPFYVKNEGNLAIKYEIKITGTQGDAKLLEAIDFYVNDATDALTSDSIGTGTLMPKGKTDSTSSAITIKGHMKESAKNEYQGLSLDGIAITVYATQANYEYDSSSDTYDSGAFAALADLYPVSKSVAIAKDASGNKQQAVINDADASGKKTYEVTVPGDAMADDADNISVTISKAASVDTANFSVVTTGNKLEQFDVTVSGIKDGNTTPITVELFIGKGYTFTGGVPVKHLKASGVEPLNGTYNANTGCVEFKTTSFSPFAVEVPDMAAAIGAGHELTYYYTLSDAVAAAEDGNTITLLRDVELSEAITIGKAVTLDLNGHTITNSLNSNGYSLVTKAAATIVNGTYKGTGTARGIGAYGNLTMRNVTVDVAGLVGVACSAADSQYTIEDSTIKGGYALCNFNNNATINVSNSTLEGESVGLYHNGSNSGLNLTVTGTKINADNNGTDATGVYISGSTTTKEAAGYQKASFTDCTVKGNAAIEVKYTNLTLNNCTVTATVPAANASYKQNNNGSTTNGFAVVSTDNAINNTMPKPEGTITINGGSYTGLIGLHNFSGIQTNFPGFVDATYVINP